MSSYWFCSAEIKPGQTAACIHCVPNGKGKYVCIYCSKEYLYPATFADFLKKTKEDSQAFPEPVSPKPASPQRESVDDTDSGYQSDEDLEKNAIQIEAEHLQRDPLKSPQHTLLNQSKSNQDSPLSLNYQVINFIRFHPSDLSLSTRATHTQHYSYASVDIALKWFLYFLHYEFVPTLTEEKQAKLQQNNQWIVHAIDEFSRHPYFMEALEESIARDDQSRPESRIAQEALSQLPDQEKEEHFEENHRKPIIRQLNDYLADCQYIYRVNLPEKNERTYILTSADFLTEVLSGNDPHAIVLICAFLTQISPHKHRQYSLA